MPSSSSLASRRCIVPVLLVALAVVPTTRAQAQPASDEVRSDLQAAEVRLDELSDRFNGAVDAYNQAQEDRRAAEADVHATQAELQVLRADRELLTRASAAHVRQLHKLGPTLELTTLFAADGAKDAGDRAAMLRRVLIHRRTDLEQLGATTIALEAAAARLVADRDSLRARVATVERQRAQMERVLADQQDEVAQLEATLVTAISREEEQRRVAEAEARRRAAEQAQAERRAAQEAVTAPSASATTPTASATPTTDRSDPPTESTPAVAPTPRANAQVAVEAALAQLGKPYRWGATGPNAFDCSGLMVYAWRQAGVNLPRTSASQFANLRRVTRDELRPGDLVFAGSPRVHHVGMYIGNGQIVHSPRAGKPVEIRSMQRSDLRGYGRPG